MVVASKDPEHYRQVAHLGDVVLHPIVGVGAVRVPDVVLVHLLPAVIVPFPVPAHLAVAHQGVT